MAVQRSPPASPQLPAQQSWVTDESLENGLSSLQDFNMCFCLAPLEDSTAESGSGDSGESERKLTDAYLCPDMCVSILTLFIRLNRYFEVRRL